MSNSSLEQDKVTLKETRIQKDSGEEVLTLWFTNKLMLCLPDLTGLSIDEIKTVFNSGIDRLAADSRNI